VFEYQLKNGLKVLVKPDNRAPVAVSQLWYKVGSSYEHNGITGVSHLLEHMMFKGTDNLEPGEFSEIIALNGGDENAATSSDYTWYYQALASDRVELSIRLEADRMRDLRFTDEEFQKEREVVIEERRRRYEDNPQSVTYEQFAAAAYVNSPYRHLPIGWMTDLQSMDKKDALDWYRTWYAPNNATLVIVGDVVPDEIFRLAKKYFGPLQPSAIPEPKPRIEVPQRGRRSIQVEIPARVPYLLMGYKVPVLNTVGNSDEVYALEVLCGILDGGESARLARNIIRGRQLALSVSAGYSLASRMDALFVFSGTPVAGVSAKQLQQALLEEIDRVKTELVSEKELSRVIAQVIAEDVYQRDSMYYQAMLLGVFETAGLGWQRLDEYIGKVRAVTPEQIRAVAQKYLVDSGLTVAELIPQTDVLPVNGAGS
jgi:zinc protease